MWNMSINPLFDILTLMGITVVAVLAYRYTETVS